jgi:hypothetical protein
LRALLVGGRRVVADDQIPGLDLMELGRQASAAVLDLQRRAGVRR